MNISSSYRRSVMITGCTTGSIGHALAREFQKRGCKVIATTRNPSTMQDLVDDPDVDTLTLDVCNEADITAACKRVHKLTGGKLDILVNNAGGGDVVFPAVETDIEVMKQVYDLNLFSVVRVVKEFTPLLLEAGRVSPAHIFNIGSLAGEFATPYASAYASAKAALKAWGDTLRVELSPFNITVTTVITGMIHNSKNVSAIGLRLAPDSIYAPVKPIFDEVFPKANESRMLPSEYATVVVNEALKPAPRAWLHAGKMTTVGWVVKTFVPLSLADFALGKNFGFDKLRAHWLSSSPS